MDNSYGTGESGLSNPIPLEKYHEFCEPEFMSTFFCSYYGVMEPKLKKNSIPASGRWGGHYHSSKELVSFNNTKTGVIIHELAHHIIHKLGKNGIGHHNFQFWTILQEMHNIWR